MFGIRRLGRDRLTGGQMKRILTYGGAMAARNLTVDCIRKNKAAGRKMTQVDARNGHEAAMLEKLGIDLITVADTDFAACRAAAPNTFMTGCQTMVQYVTEDEALGAAIKVAEAGADAIYTPRGLRTVERLAGEGLAVQGHLGLVPRKSTWVGGLRIIGKTADEAMRLYADFKRFEDAGGYAVEVECVATEALQLIGPRTPIVTHSIGAGSGGDIIFSFFEDITGESEVPYRHVKAWADVAKIKRKLAKEQEKGVKGFRDEVLAGTFPHEPHQVPMAEGEPARLAEMLDKWRPVHG